jgi:hypothetical protein
MLTSFVFSFSVLAFATGMGNRSEAAPPQSIGPADATRTLLVFDPSLEELPCEAARQELGRDYSALVASLNATLETDVKIQFVEAAGARKVFESADRLSSAFVGIIAPQHFVKSILGDEIDASNSLADFARLSSQSFPDGDRGVFIVATSDPARTILDIDDYEIRFQQFEPYGKRIAKSLRIDDLTWTPSDQTPAETLASIDPGKSAALISEIQWLAYRKCHPNAAAEHRMIGQTESMGPLMVFESPKMDAATREVIRLAFFDANSKAVLDGLQSDKGFLSTSPDDVEKRLLEQFR